MRPFLAPMLTLALVVCCASVRAQPADPDASAPAGASAPPGVLVGPAPETGEPPSAPPRMGPPEQAPTATADPPSEIQEPRARTLWRPSAGAALGCALGIPCGGVGALGGAAGVGGAAGLLAGFPLALTLLGVATGACVGVPAMACAGPCSVLGATTGTLAGAKSGAEGDVRLGPTLLAALPALILATIGSAVGAVGTGGMILAVVGMNPGELRSWGAVLVLAVLLSVFAGPAAALMTVSANALFGQPLPAEAPADEEYTQRTPRPLSIAAHRPAARASSAMRF